MLPMIGNRGGPGGSMADREELCRNLTEVKIKKNDRIKQNGKSKFSDRKSVV